MIKLFKNVDDKLADIGFVNVRDDKYGCEYERRSDVYGFVHKVFIGHKESGRHILQSYDPNTYVESCCGSAEVGLTGYEMKLFLKKMKKIGLYSGKEVTKK